MKANERMARRVRPIQLVLTEDEHKRLKVHAAMKDASMGDILKERIADIIDPMGHGAFADSRVK